MVKNILQKTVLEIPLQKCLWSKLQVSHETFDLLRSYESMVCTQQKVSNLVSEKTIPVFWDRHIADSAQLLLHTDPPRTWIDLGSGAGLPGLVIAILLRSRPNLTVHLIESHRRKAAFLERTGQALGLSVVVHPVRIESLCVGDFEPPAVLSARALVPLDRLMTLVAPWLESGATALFHVGVRAEPAVRKLARADVWSVHDAPSVTGSGSIVKIRHR